MKLSTNIRYYKKDVKQKLKRFQNVSPLSKDSNPFIPLETSLLSNINAYKNMLFLDIGSGPGTILKFAQSCGHNVYGIENNLSYREALKDFKYMIADLNQVDPIFYSQFDFIYSYLPIKRELFKVFLETKLIPNMAVNSILYIPHFEIENKRLTKIKPFLYRVGAKI